MKPDNSKITTIQVKKVTIRKLEKLKIIPQEPYDSLINRLLANYQPTGGDASK